MYKHALSKTPIVSKSSDAGKIKKILDEGRDVLFWNWLNILRTEVRVRVLVRFRVPGHR